MQPFQMISTMDIYMLCTCFYYHHKSRWSLKHEQAFRFLFQLFYHLDPFKDRVHHIWSPIYQWATDPTTFGQCLSFFEDLWTHIWYSYMQQRPHLWKQIVYQIYSEDHIDIKNKMPCSLKEWQSSFRLLPYPEMHMYTKEHTKFIRAIHPLFINPL
jgi:hypothetical protein